MPTEEQLQEIHRLAVRGDAAAIAQAVGARLAEDWLPTSRFREVRDVSLQTLALGPHAETLNDLARAQHVLGEVAGGPGALREALKIYDSRGRPGGLATTLTNIGMVYRSLGQPQQALTSITSRRCPSDRRWVTGPAWPSPSPTSVWSTVAWAAPGSPPVLPASAAHPGSGG